MNIITSNLAVVTKEKEVYFSFMI